MLILITFPFFFLCKQENIKIQEVKIFEMMRMSDCAASI